MNDLVSVVMATYNGDKFIRLQIESILNQSYSNLEIVVVDDASSDNTLTILQEYANADDRISIYPNDKNIGFVANFERGLMLVKGEYIALSDQDDIFDKNFDSKVERTKNRPLANGSISIKFALIQLMIFLVISSLILITLPEVAIYTSLIAAVMTAFYPLMKRITYLPQVFLGLTYSTASLIGYASITNNISINAVILYLAIGFWTIGFDVIYGFMDIKDDKKINVKSMAI